MFSTDVMAEKESVSGKWIKEHRKIANFLILSIWKMEICQSLYDTVVLKKYFYSIFSFYVSQYM